MFITFQKKGRHIEYVFPDGDPARARTEDPKIKSLLLYQLSYGVKMDGKYTRKLFCRKFLAPIFAVLKREHSSAGSEHLPYKQRVRGSNPCAPTEIKKGLTMMETLFYLNEFQKG
jgi:hypothetical protein